MKQFAVAAMAAAVALADSSQNEWPQYNGVRTDNPDANKDKYVPADCLFEIPVVFGAAKGKKKTDLDYIPNMSVSSRITEIAICTNETNNISGIQLLWSDGGKKSKTSRIGTLSGLDRFADMVQLEGPALTSLEKYWFVEASPDSEEYYLNIRPQDNADERWNAAFDLTDRNNDGYLDWYEYNEFFYVLRMDLSNRGLADSRFYTRPEIDYNVADFNYTTAYVDAADTNDFYAQQNMIERLYAGWEAITAISGDAKQFDKNDWENLELRMEWWFKAGKLDVTGDVYTNWERSDNFDAIGNTVPDSIPTNGLKNKCHTEFLDDRDRITMAAMQYTPYAL